MVTSEADQSDADAAWAWALTKYTSRNPVVQWLLDNFFRHIGKTLARLEPGARVLEVGCGPGASSRRILGMLAGQAFEVSDVDERFVTRLQQTGFPVPVRQESVLALQRPDRSYDCVLLLEVLEHLEEYERALAELFRVSRQYVVVSVPREPYWRLLNLARGKYLRQGGNPPGHVNHWSAAAVVRLVSRFGPVVQVYTPIPWTIVLARVPDAPAVAPPPVPG